MGRKPLDLDRELLQRLHVDEELSYDRTARKYAKATGYKISGDTVRKVLQEMGLPPRSRLDYYVKK
jgi:hypothetical protein